MQVHADPHEFAQFLQFVFAVGFICVWGYWLYRQFRMFRHVESSNYHLEKIHDLLEEISRKR